MRRERKKSSHWDEMAVLHERKSRKQQRLEKSHSHKDDDDDWSDDFDGDWDHDFDDLHH